MCAYQQIAANSNNSADDNLVSLLRDEVQKLSDDKGTLQERVKRANEENLNLIEKVQVKILKLLTKS